MLRSNPDNSPEKKAVYQERLRAMSDDDLLTETKLRIWLSAYASNNTISCYHWQSDYAHAEWIRRGKVEKYEQAWNEAVKQ